jgi:hypothetical protein
MPSVGFEATIPVFEGAKTFYILERADTVIGNTGRDSSAAMFYSSPWNVHSVSCMFGTRNPFPRLCGKHSSCSNPLKTESESESESYVTTDSQLASLSWNKAPIWGLWPDINYSFTITVLLLWGALSDERTGLSFVYATGPRQCSPSVRGPSVTRPYFTVSDLTLPFSSPPTTRRVTVEVFDPASTRVFSLLLKTS